MKEKKFSRLVNHPRHIPGVHTYCDRWCECCPFTLRCSVFAVEAEMTKDQPPRARSIENLWPRMDAAFEMAAALLQTHIEHPGVTPVKDPIFKSVARRAGFHRIGIASKRCMEFAHVFINAHGQAIEALAPDDAIHPISAAEAFEVIAWFHLFITVKLSRALSQREHEEEYEDEIAGDPELAAMPRDQDGSAKIALIGIDRSITAWAILSLHQPAHADSARSAMLTLSRLRTAIEKDFPKARLFVRAGFDTHTFPKRKKGRDMLVLPLGTQIVTRTDVRGPDGVPRHPAGAVGTIITADTSHSYRVRFADGFEAFLSRFDLMALHVFQQSQISGTLHPLDEFDLNRHVIFRCVIGSRAYNLDHANSDTDRRGIYLPPASMHWSLYGVPEQLEDSATQECYWELQKAITLALKANPNILECLYSPIVEHTTPLADELLAGREMFLSKLVFQTYNGYVMSQFKKLQQDLRTKGDVKWKHVMHLIRLLLSGISILRDGHLELSVEKFRADLLAIRDGHMPWPQIEAWRLALHTEFDAAFAHTKLPDKPDYQRANAFLLKARASMVGQ